MLGDNISIKDMDLDTLLRKARAGSLPRCLGGPWRELLGQRAFRLESAEVIVNKAVAEMRALKPEEAQEVDRLLSEAERITPVAKELWEQQRRDFIEAGGVPVSRARF